MLIMINRDNKMNIKRDNVRIIRIILDLHGVIVDSRKVTPLPFFQVKIKEGFHIQREQPSLN